MSIVLFDKVREILDHAVANRAFPCAVAEVGAMHGPIWTYATGQLIYEVDAPAASLDTVFDLASLTKVLATTTIALRQVSDGRLDLDTPVAELIAEWNQPDRADVRVRDLLEHSSGLPGHRPYFLSMAGRAAYQSAISREPLEYAPRDRAVYSDLGFMMLGFILADAGGAPLDDQFDDWKRLAAVTDVVTFHWEDRWRMKTAPTEIDAWRNRLLIGEVHDENAFALSGVAAHAGLFGAAAAVGECARWWLQRLAGRDDPATGVRSSNAADFVRRSHVPGSSRALGWDTMLPTSSCGMHFTPRAVGHTGYTGTSLWLDPTHDIYAVLLTNRVHPTRRNDQMQQVRRAFHDAVIEQLKQ